MAGRGIVRAKWVTHEKKNTEPRSMEGASCRGHYISLITERDEVIFLQLLFNLTLEKSNIENNFKKPIY